MADSKEAQQRRWNQKCADIPHRLTHGKTARNDILVYMKARQLRPSAYRWPQVKIRVTKQYIPRMHVNAHVILLGKPNTFVLFSAPSADPKQTSTALLLSSLQQWYTIVLIQRVFGWLKRLFFLLFSPLGPSSGPRSATATL